MRIAPQADPLVEGGLIIPATDEEPCDAPAAQAKPEAAKPEAAAWPMAERGRIRRMGL